MHDKMCFSLGGKWQFIIFPPTLSVVLVMGCCPGNRGCCPGNGGFECCKWSHWVMERAGIGGLVVAVS